MGLFNLFNTACDMAEHTAIIKGCGSYTNYAAVMNNLNLVHEMQQSKQHTGCFIEAQTVTSNPFKAMATMAEKVAKKVADQPVMPKINLGDTDTDD